MSLDVAALVNQLPAFSPSLSELMRAVKDEKVEATQLEKLLIGCPVIAGRVLQIANSSFYGFSRQISSVREACVILGKRTLENLIYTLAVIEQFEQAEPGTDAINYDDVWRNSLFSASLTQVISKSLKLNANNLFTACLFQNLGLILLDYFTRDQLQKMIVIARGEGKSLLEVTEQMMGVSYFDITRQALEFWRFPEDICASVGRLGTEQAESGSSVIRFSSVCAQALGHALILDVYPKALSAEEFKQACPDTDVFSEQLVAAERMYEQLAQSLFGS